MQKKVLITGATDGIGFETAKMLIKQGHYLLLHGRNADKLKQVEIALSGLSDSAQFESYLADLSSLEEVRKFAQTVRTHHTGIDILINNAGVYNAPIQRTIDGLDLRFAVNTVAPYLLTQLLLPILGKTSRVLNLSSAAQSSVNIKALTGRQTLNDHQAYAQSKLALTIWSRTLGLKYKETGPIIIAINPKSLLGSKMVQENFGIAGADLSLGAEVLCQAALCDEFANASGLYFDNDNEKFTAPHPDALDDNICQALMDKLEEIVH